jgi:hypothetical protein
MANGQIAASKPGADYVPLDGSERKPRPGFKAAGAADPNQEVRVIVKVRPKQDLPDPA